MDYVIDLHEQPFYAYITVKGSALVDGIAELLEDLSVSEPYPRGIGILLDLRELDIEKFTTSKLLRIIDDIEQYLGKDVSGPCAAVVDNPVAFGVARMYGLFGGDMLHSNYNVFYNPDDAVLWLLECVLLQKQDKV